MLTFYPQEHPESCVPACVRMVLKSADIELTESVIYLGCETDIGGTLPSKAATYTESIGFNSIAPRLASVNELEAQMTSECLYPIVFVNLSILLGINVIHAVVVESLNIGKGFITVKDPAFPPTGRRQWSLSLFEIGWQAARRQTILITM